MRWCLLCVVAKGKTNEMRVIMRVNNLWWIQDLPLGPLNYIYRWVAIHTIDHHLSCITTGKSARVYALRLTLSQW